MEGNVYVNICIDLNHSTTFFGYVVHNRGHPMLWRCHGAREPSMPVEVNALWKAALNGSAPNQTHNKYSI